jgi:hypothetical protein
MRSELVTRFFESLLEGRLHRLERKRAIVLRNELIPYNAPPAEWPAKLRALLPGEGAPLVDELGAAEPTREALAKYYGRAFVDLIFDETLRSYPSDQRQKDLGVPESQLLVNLYPWFFPQAERARLTITESRRYQDVVRSQPREYMLYPDQGGFASFPQALARKLEGNGGTVLSGAHDLAFEFDGSRQQLETVAACGRRLSAPRVYWCSGLDALYKLLEMPAPNLTPDTFLLGSFEFEREIRSDYSEILLGDPDHAMNRISFPGKLALEQDNLVQVEFSFATADRRWLASADAWRDAWTRSLQRLGIAQHGNRVVDFDLRMFPLYSNVYGAEGERLPPIDFSARLGAETNLKPVLPTYAKVNINTRIPQYLDFLTRDILQLR